MDMSVTKDFTAKKVTVAMIRAWIATGEPRAVINVPITPEIAKFLLTLNRPGETNRRINDSYVRMAMDRMKNSEWENTGEPIIISDEAILNDGQHRLKAILELGMTVLMDLRFGIRRKAFANTNSGRRRSGADALTIADIPNANNIAAMARMALCYERGLPGSLHQRIDNGSIVAGALRWPDMQQAHAVTQGIGKPFRNSATNTLAFFALRTADDEVVEDFFHVLRYGEGSKDHPAHQLREFLRVLSISQGNDFTKRGRVFAACLIAWNAHRKASPHGGKINLYWREGNAYPVCKDLVL